MPGKVNPVVPEFVISVAHKVYANDGLITGLCALGCLELNAYLPVIGHALLESIELLQGADQTLRTNLLEGIEIISETAYNNLINSPALTTALLPYIGYNKASVLASEMKTKRIDLFEANKNLMLIDEQKLAGIIRPENLLKEGFSIKDIAL